jgi:YidC/Oxa1 family membrane protein insertase
MEHARIFIAIALSFLIFLLWDFFFTPKPPPQKSTPATVEKPKEQEKQTAAMPFEQPAELPPTAATPAPETPVLTETAPVRIITVDSPLYTAKISARDAAVTSFVLKKFRETAEEDSPLKELVAPGLPTGTVLVGFQKGSLPGLQNAIFAVDREKDTFQVSGTSDALTFTWVSPEGVVVEKQYVFSKDSYLVGMNLTVKNGSSQPILDQMYIALQQKKPKDKRRVYGFTGPSALINNSLEQVDLDDIDDKNTFAGTIRWIALEKQYFISSVVANNPIEAAMSIRLVGESLFENRFVMAENTFRPGTQQTIGTNLFFGPKSLSLLRGLDNGLAKAINFGWFDFLAKPCLWLMNFLYNNLIPNYGVAIIILTLITKGLLWPLGTKSYRSMSQMKKLQPLIQEIKEKYGSDRKKINEETMKLYKTYKINPLGGCLPMLVQLPVFLALYRMLYQAIELRHAPFFGWINDLSAPDRLFRFDFSIPFMQPPYGIPVLTLVMGASMLLQQKMSPPMGDPTQAKMMMLMPLVFTFIFINFSSGLVLYWLVNNIISMAQQYYITQKTT